ncbi:type II/IV secretion system ATPase tadZ/cpaE [Vibrio ishigakensis]|uniref:Type II/IV secretion system ATPase tadZ/cpaE n=1 Tax=Vibrio ishigakensis TaxID=1481914 RepID=A0A0B8P240_9VIBR|nr:type II/IV secretion system ATPase tadZ/cpaE [Vibrio ishigakensis]
MFDLSKTLNSKSQTANLKAKPDNDGIHCTFIYQTQECLDLVQEVFRFEGWDEPKLVRLNLAKVKLEQEHEIILLELSESDDVVKDAKRFASKLPTGKGIIVIGKEDSIVTIRALREFGFYYMFWPFSKSDLADFIMHVEKNLKSFSGVSEHRKAKRVAVVGAKGGLGVSFICCELASYLSTRSSDTIVVDHHGNHSNMDVLLSLDDFTRQNIDEYTAPIHELDEEGALSYLIRVRQNLRLLALDSEKKPEDVLQYTNTLYELLSRSTNFVIEDFLEVSTLRLFLKS